MKSKYLEFVDGVIVEVGDPGADRAEMNSRDTVNKRFAQITDNLDEIIQPIARAFSRLKSTLEAPIEVKEAEVEIALGFSYEGNLVIAKANMEAQLIVKITFQRVQGQVRGAASENG